MIWALSPNTSPFVYNSFKSVLQVATLKPVFLKFPAWYRVGPAIKDGGLNPYFVFLYWQNLSHLPLFYFYNRFYNSYNNQSERVLVFPMLVCLKDAFQDTWLFWFLLSSLVKISANPLKTDSRQTPGNRMNILFKWIFPERSYKKPRN